MPHLYHDKPLLKLLSHHHTTSVGEAIFLANNGVNSIQQSNFTLMAVNTFSPHLLLLIIRDVEFEN